MFTADDRLQSLIDENQHLILVMCRSGLSLGYGDKTVRQVCEEDNADCDTFLAICNYVSDKPTDGLRISLPHMMNYLERTHTYFLQFMFPSIRRKLIESIDCSGKANDVALLLLQFFDGYVAEVDRHMSFENDTIFDYVKKLLSGDVNADFRIESYRKGHGSMVEKLNELKDIFIRHYHQKSNDMLNSALFDIMLCEQDLMGHCRIENDLFLPEAARLEESLLDSLEDSDTTDSDPDSSPLGNLTDREKEIIREVARGKSNKEIAECLHLSVHTIMTHRRNISAKLQIHSASGLTIFAILHNLIDLQSLSFDN